LSIQCQASLLPSTTLFRSVTKLIDKRDARIPKIKQEAKSVATVYMKKFQKVKVKQMYRELLTNRELLGEVAPEWPFEEVAHFIKDRKSTRLNSSHVKISYA